ncbi:type I-U CRISPR-associated protein Cas7 [bacterium]|nr:type I-U CRISPR-associated protein Cas7 [candidate division CSSED10-310 bacterium]
MIEHFSEIPMILLHAELTPVQGDRFQPTGFPDIGAAVYERPDGTRMLLIESAQSMANRLEAVCLLGNGPDIHPDLTGIPYIVARLTGATDQRTSSLIEPHRLNSPFIITHKEFGGAFQTQCGYDKEKLLDWPKIAATIFKYDPNSLLHGAFLANLGDGRIRTPRMLTAFIEAENVREAASGGVKFNPFDPAGKIRATAHDKDVYGNVPYHRMEYTAGKIRAYFNIDMSLIRNYNLPDAAQELLLLLGLYKIRAILSSGLRLRTACAFKMIGEIQSEQPRGFILPALNTLKADLRKTIEQCRAAGLFAVPAVTELITSTKKKESSKKEATEETAE